MVIEWMAAKTARVIKEADPERTASKEVLEYGLKIIYNATSIIVISLLIGLWLDRFIEAIIALTSFATLRFITGGYHVKSSDYCVIISIIMITTIFTLRLNDTFLLIMNIVSILLVILLAPKNINSDLFKNKENLLKVLALVIVCSNFIYIKSEVITLALFVQLLTLIPNERKN